MPLDEYLPDEYWDEWMRSPGRQAAIALDYRGRRYAMQTPWNHVRGGSYFYTLYNRDLITEAGLPEPYDLYQAGEWTWDAMGDIAIELTADTTGDGDIDQFGMTSWSTAETVYFGFSNEISPAEFSEDGRAFFTYDRAEAIETIDQIYEWQVVEGITGGGMNDFIDGNVVFNPVVWLWSHRFPKADMEDDWDVVPIPMGPRSDRHRYPTNDARGTLLPITAEDPEGLIALTHFLFRVEDLEPERITSPAYADRYMISRQHMEVFETSMLEWDGEFDLFHGTEYNQMIYEGIGAVLADEQSSTAAMDEIRPAAQSWLDEFLGD